MDPAYNSYADDINDRYPGQEFPARKSAAYNQSRVLVDRHFQMAHRHKISLITEYNELEDMNDVWLERLIHEYEDYARIEEWARWMEDNSGSGRKLMSTVTAFFT